LGPGQAQETWPNIYLKLLSQAHGVESHHSRKDAKDAKLGEIEKSFLCVLCGLGAINVLV
jgi:hypothetical protein